jgi:hypothetical protein
MWFSLLLLPSVASAWTQPTVQATGSVGAGLGGLGRGGATTATVALELPYSKFTVAPTVSGYLLGHRSGGLFQDETLDATVQVDSRTTAQGVEAGVLGRLGKEKVGAELHLSAGYAASAYWLTGELDGTPLPGVVETRRGLSTTVMAGGVAQAGPVDIVFALRWRRIPLGETGGGHLIGPTVGVRWGP